ncbi:MAG: hypothetical protein KA791_13805 [Flavobacteriales bacterium]|nr:hypothetical protein [Flavobacteriales bacterium]
MKNPALSRTLMLLCIAVILACCTASAILAIRSGHNARAASTFFAGLAFSALFLSRLPKRKS